MSAVSVMPDADQFTFRLAEMSRRRNMGAPELSTATGISRSTLYNYLSGKTVPRFGHPHRTALANALGVSIGWLNGFEDEPRDREASDGSKSQDE